MNFNSLFAKNYCITIGLALLLILQPLYGTETPTPIIDYTKIITSISIQGVHQTPKNNVPSIFTFQNKPGEKVIERFVKSDLKQLYETGYFSKVFASTQSTKEGLKLIYHVVEHPIITNISIKGNHSFSQRNLQKLIASKKNRPLNFKLIQSDKAILESYYHKKYFDLFSVDMMQLNRNTLEIFVNETAISRIEIQGTSILRQNILTRLLETQPGYSFNSLKLRRDRERLLRLGYFSDVSSPILKQDVNTNQLIVIFKVTEKKYNRIELGIEQEVEQTVGFIKGVKNHVLIQSDTLSGKVQIGSADRLLNNYRLKYHQPWLFNRLNVSWSTDLWRDITQEIAANQAISQTKTIESTLRTGRMVTLGFPLKSDLLTLKTKGKYERILPQEANSQISEYAIGSLSAELSYYSIISPFNPKQGSYGSIQYERGGHFQLFTTPGIQFDRTVVNAAKFIPAGKRATIGLRANAGIFRSQETTQTFETENFIIGGAYSLRGYNENNFPFSGSRKVLFNFEYRQDIFSKFQYVLFYDMGNAFDTGFSINPKTFHKGYGIGIRYFTPVGPIRVDFARGESEYRIHFGLGQLF